MKIAVYAIAKNEESFAARWLSSVQGADYICVLDTGSTDRTVELLRAGGARVEQEIITPWRFDTARNKSLALVPDCDMCLSLDMDEILSPGWREAVEAVWRPGVTRLRFPYIVSHTPEGEDGVSFSGDKFHARHGYVWKYPVHEIVVTAGPETGAFVTGMRVDHWPDETKSRSSYLPLLESSVAEDPQDDRNLHYLGREYFFWGRYAEAIKTLRRHLALPTATWLPERAASMRYIGKGYEGLCAPELAELWYRRAADEAPEMREALMDLAGLCYTRQDWRGVVRACGAALGRKDRPGYYMTEPGAWGARPWDLLSVAWWNLGEKTYAKNCCAEAARLSSEERIHENLVLMGGER